MQYNLAARIAYALIALAALGLTVRADSSDASPASSPLPVAIQDFAFKPATLYVPVGATVTWTNEDRPAHTATSSGTVPQAFDSGDLQFNQSWSFTFTKAGTYTYLCSDHPYMIGKIIVGATAPPASP